MPASLAISAAEIFRHRDRWRIKILFFDLQTGNKNFTPVVLNADQKRVLPDRIGNEKSEFFPTVFKRPPETCRRGCIPDARIVAVH